MTDTDLLPNDLQQLLQLFSTLPDVRFPDLEASALQSAVAKLKDRALELASVEAQLAALRAQFDEEQDGLIKKGQRLHAYLRVFAEHDEALLTKLNALSLPRVRRATPPRAPDAPAVTADGTTASAVAPKKRGRPRKVVPSSDALFSDVAPPPAA